MSVWCNACGKQSQDTEFCDHCNADLGTSGENLPPERCPLSAEGVILTRRQRETLAFPDASALLEAEGQHWRIHWLAAPAWEAHKAVIQKRLALPITSLPKGRLLEDPRGQWLVFEATEQTVPWDAAGLRQGGDRFAELLTWIFSLAYALEALHRHELVWLRFDPSAVEDAGPLEEKTFAGAVADARWLKFTNLDVELFPFRSMPERVRVQPQFAAPEVVQFRIDEIGPRTDVFHLATFAYYWLAALLPAGMPGDGLERFEYEMPFLRVYAPQLPVGILPVIRRGMALTPRARHETPRQFAEALADSIERARSREVFVGPVRWEIGGSTRTGRAKAESNRVNEDSILLKDYEAGTLAVVADGVSTCDIGSGEIASMMTTIVLENAFAEGCTHESFPAIVSTATKTGSEGLLEWALARGCRADLEAGKDLMGTTVTIGWLQGHELSIANLGDSRAYLVTEDAIEQLTVDGDLASDLLAQGASPQEIRELGVMARALRECVGGCTKTEDGQLCCLPESARPKLTRWPLLPGDVVILCSDGLVEEGYFLEPKTVHEIVCRCRDLSAADLALRLVEAADSLQRVPTVLEPDGFGDNISCVVIKVTA